MQNSKATIRFAIEGSKSVWKLSGVHPRWGPHWTRVKKNENQLEREIEASLGDIFKIISPRDERLIAVVEGAVLKEIDHVVFEDFMYSVTRRWYNILQNTGTFKEAVEQGD